MGYHALSKGCGKRDGRRNDRVKKRNIAILPGTQGTVWNRKNLEVKWNDNGKYNKEAVIQMQINFCLL